MVLILFKIRRVKFNLFENFLQFMKIIYQKIGQSQKMNYELNGFPSSTIRKIIYFMI
jgi:hypothetical protein